MLYIPFKMSETKLVVKGLVRDTKNVKKGIWAFLEIFSYSY